MTFPPKNIGFFLLAIYLILAGALGLGGISIPFVMPLLALAAGICILIGR